jgi:tetratricopeptide (TPR) repeat protein
MANKDQFYDTIDELIVRGELSKAHLLFRKLTIGNIPREQRYLYANLARRLNEPIKGLKALNKVIRSESTNNQASDEEKLEHSGNLITLNLHREGLSLLCEVSYKKLPESYLVNVFANFKTWDYEKSIPLLQTYLGINNIPDYKVVLAKVNLLACYIFQEQFENVITLVNEIERICKKKGYNLLLANALELRAQIHFSRKEYNIAWKQLDLAESFIDHTNNFSHLFILKWKCFIKSIKRDDIGQLKPALALARKMKHNESIRSIDYFKACYTKDHRLMNQVFVGTPFSSFRKKILNNNEWFKPQFPLSINSRARCLIDFDNSKIIEADHVSKMKPFQLKSKIIQSIVSDHYVEKSGFSIFQDVYPGEYFNPHSSINKVQKAISRVNNELIKNHSFNIKCTNGQYRLSKKVGIIFSNQESQLERHHNQILKFFGDRKFKCKDLEEYLKVSKKSALRILDSLIKESIILKIGCYKNTRYKISKK